MAFLHNFKSSVRELTPYFIFILLSATLGPFLFGYHLAELNAPQDVITCLKRSIGTTDSSLPQCIPMNATQLGLVSSAFTVGGLFGALGAGPLSAQFGRLRPMRWTTAFAATGPIAEALAPNIGVMVVGRFISGIAAGAALVVVPLYISEIAPLSQKGFFGAFTQIMTNVGIFTTQLLGYFFSHDEMWRLILAIGGIFGLVQLCGLLFAVESPRWQANHGQPRAAKVNLKRIRGSNADLSEETKSWSYNTSEQEIGEQESLLHPGDSVSTSNDKSASLGTFEIFSHPLYARATFSAMMVLAAQQLCGINAIIMYGVSLLSGLLKANSALLNIFVSILNIIVTIACAPLIDVLGRKPCLLSSIGGMGVSSILLAIAIRSSMPVLSTISVLLFVGSFALGLGPVPFMLVSELVGPEAVGASQSWGLAANWIATFLVAQFFPMLNEWLGKGTTFFVFAALDALFFVLVFFLVPETKGKKNAEEVWGVQSRQED